MIIKEHTGKEVAQPENVADIIFAILDVEDEISREREHLWVIGLGRRGHVIIGKKGGVFYSFAREGKL